MPRPVEFHFDFVSPNAYLCHKVLPAITRRTGVPFNYVPVLLVGVFKLTNNQSPIAQFKGIKNKNEYMRLEMKRFMVKHGITQFQMNPHFPVNTVQIMRGATAAGMVRPEPATQFLLRPRGDGLCRRTSPGRRRRLGCRSCHA